MAKKDTKSRTGAGGSARALPQAAAKTPAKAADAPARPRPSPFKFVSQVRQEASKVTWPTRNETTVTTIMVFVMVIFASLFFFLVDQILGTAVRWILGL